MGKNILLAVGRTTKTSRIARNIPALKYSKKQLSQNQYEKDAEKIKEFLEHLPIGTWEALLHLLIEDKWVLQKLEMRIATNKL